MNLNRDITSRKWLHIKGWLFLFMGCVAGGLLLAESFSARQVVLLAICVWAFCRFYYFLFYVLEKYAGRDQRYAGIVDALKHLLRGKNKPAS